jgi:hypothetical protein
MILITVHYKSVDDNVLFSLNCSIKFIYVWCLSFVEFFPEFIKVCSLFIYIFFVFIIWCDKDRHLPLIIYGTVPYSLPYLNSYSISNVDVQSVKWGEYDRGTRCFAQCHVGQCRPIKYIYIAKIINIKWTNCTNLPMLVCNPNYIRCCSVDSNATDVR